jgi:hypothetical protein
MKHQKRLAEIIANKAVSDVSSAPLEINMGNESVEDLLRVKHYPTLKIGIDKLDKGGVPTGMNLIAGQSGAGKSWFMTYLVYVAWELNGLRSAIFSLEMDYQGIKKRMLQSYSNMSYEDFLYATDFSLGVSKIKQIQPTIIDYTQSDNQITTSGFLDKFKELYDKGIRVFLFDHFHEIPGASVNDRNQQVSEEWGEVFKFIRNTYDDVWMFILVQSNKEGYKKKIIKKEDMAGSVSVVAKCDFFLSINRTEDPEKEGHIESKEKTVKIWVDKSRRTGMDKYISLAILTETGMFVDSARKGIQDYVDPEKQLSL